VKPVGSSTESEMGTPMNLSFFLYRGGKRREEASVRQLTFPDSRLGQIQECIIHKLSYYWHFARTNPQRPCNLRFYAPSDCPGIPTASPHPKPQLPSRREARSPAPKKSPASLTLQAWNALPRIFLGLHGFGRSGTNPHPWVWLPICHIFIFRSVIFSPISNGHAPRVS